MGRLRFPEIQTRPTEGLDLISLTVDAFQQLFPPFEAAFQTHMAEWRLDGQPRTARGSPTDQNWPLQAPEDRLLWILVYLKTYPLQVVQGACSAWARAKPIGGFMSCWVPCGRRCAQGDAPTRSVKVLAQRLKVAEAAAGAGGVPPPISSTASSPPAAAFTPVPAFSLLGTMARNGASSALRTRLHRRAVIVARKHATP
jgi:hypothetical protein